MATPGGRSRTHGDVRWHRVQPGQRQRAEEEDEEEPELYRSDEFRVWIMKVLPCSKRYCHDWTRCPFAHPGEKATRRDPRSNSYTGIACPDMKKDQRCPRGDYCPYAHNVFEYWLHHTRYRTALCREIGHCNRKVCFFAHDLKELRQDVERPYVSPEQLVQATEKANRDPAVQRAYHAPVRDSDRPGTLTRYFTGLPGPEEELAEALAPGQQSQFGQGMSPPQVSMQDQQVMHNFQSMLRNELAAAAMGDASQGQFAHSGTGNSRTASYPANNQDFSVITGPGGLPALDQRATRRSASDPLRRNGLRSQPLPDAESVRQTIHEQGPTVFNNGLSSAPGYGSGDGSQGWKQLQTAPVPSYGNQMALMSGGSYNGYDALHTAPAGNPAGHYLSGYGGLQLPMATGKQENNMGQMGQFDHWETPRGPLDQNALFSQSSSSTADRQASMDATNPGSLQAAFRRKYQEHRARREASGGPLSRNRTTSAVFSAPSDPTQMAAMGMPSQDGGFYSSIQSGPSTYAAQADYAVSYQQAMQQQAAQSGLPYVYPGTFDLRTYNDGNQGLFAVSAGSQGLHNHPLLVSDQTNTSPTLTRQNTAGFLGSEALPPNLQTTSSLDSEILRSTSSAHAVAPSHSDAERDAMPQYSSALAERLTRHLANLGMEDPAAVLRQLEDEQPGSAGQPLGSSPPNNTSGSI